MAFKGLTGAEKKGICFCSSSAARTPLHAAREFGLSHKLLDMLEDPSVIDKQRVTVEFKSAVTDWEEHEAEPSLRGGWYRWTIPDRVPCHDHKVRITVYGEDGSKNTFYYPHTIVAPNMEDIIIISLPTPHHPTSVMGALAGFQA